MSKPVVDPFDTALGRRTFPIGPLSVAPDWMDDASCAESELDFFPYRERRGQRASDEPLAVCEECPVRAQCLAYAFEQRESTEWGIYGGTLGAERWAVRDLEDPVGVLLGELGAA